MVMTTIGELLARDLDRKIEEIIQVDQADEQSVYEEIRYCWRTRKLRNFASHITFLKAQRCGKTSAEISAL
jgi:hypothetical protein